jgi:transcriptional regulator with XRE-family HTH domain
MENPRSSRKRNVAITENDAKQADEYAAQLGARIRNKRNERGWKQPQLAEMLRDRGVASIQTPTVAKIEAGERAVKIHEAAVLADIFGISIDALMGRRVSARADLMSAARQVVDAKITAAAAVSASQSQLVDALAQLVDADLRGTYDPLADDARAAVNALEAASAALAQVGQRPKSAMNRAMTEALKQLLRDEGEI